MLQVLFRWIINTLALLVITYIPGIRSDSWITLFIAALVLGLLNAVVRPILFWLTLPLTVVTLGLFLIVLNAAMLALTALVVPGFHIDSFLAAIAGAVVLGLISLVTNRIGNDPKK